MERITDKLVVIACCVGALALTGTGADVVGSLLASVTCAFAAELLRGRARLAPALVYVLFSLAVPVAGTFVAPVAYDLAAGRHGRWPAAACALLPLVASWRGAPAALVALLAVLVASLLAGRTRRMVAQCAENLRAADDLREREVVRLVAEGLDNREVAAAAYMGEGTVRNHISQILAKLGLRNRTQIAVAYWRALR